ncbi:4-(cytidine 5'-diphospho)-2-C-methyl-D-erythritol kinase [Neisseria animalis]|uniref:4-diphosphocytidyl-2-C-methyl-D-erythritol kinase n=1 Tax=Neisseria animalis TaxID=492 RepID=A0A5P3MV72_NEIAN|nr:4-(cytidine 5'-diphospho)-2-C-methyl-D-erythritol kinase [Neisseria animalis]QEY24671.1 4-(cytidine 5'-diphospho)-2-C-methyl-D-erythritol kinase [Neisseria animalis]ROW31463.1 4-(cytidine 5'-diphospho)-2-C-methyl-D-erythritol kinase [Neisseria animalis]VEE07605.1 4-diphosphocytidyl-2-C-methyl-D-erythritol kinase [Neisseria animalis]
MDIPPYAQAFAAPAKLNLDLRITARRADGYHELESIFCLINLHDTVYLSVREDGRVVIHTPAQGVAPEQDLAYRAAVLLQKHCNVGKGADIWLDKKIPMGGGLGGGSSDAATVLLVLNHLWQCSLNRQELMDLGITLGADVPFFIFGRNAFAKGIGEKLTAIDVPKQWYVVVKPNVHVATAKIFAHPLLTRNSKPSIMPTFQTLQPFQNDMQAVVFREYPEVWQAYLELSKYGKTLMTGSGACLFTAFDNHQEAYNLYRQVSETYEAYCVEGLDFHPLHCMV